MKLPISVFTPCHDPRWLDDLYKSLTRQSFHEWEWVVLLNNGAVWQAPHDARVRVIHYNGDSKHVGFLKGETLKHCRGEIFVEVDSDDVLLTTNLLDEVFDALADQNNVTLAYSNFTQLNEDLSPNLEQFRADHGWVYQTVDLDTSRGDLIDANVIIPVLPRPTPHNVSHIWYAPNHIRAFPKWAYEKSGGYNDLEICDDLDLMCRLYQIGEFKAVGGLYGQRIHEKNTQKDPGVNARIQNLTLDLYEQNIAANGLAWARRNNLRALELGGGNNVAEGFQSVDMYPPADFVHKFPEPLRVIPDGSVGVIRCVDFLEHVADQRAMMDEIWRMLAPNGLLLSLTPSTDGRGAFQDPTHVSFWNQNSFWYWTDDAMISQYSPQNRESRARFQISSLKTVYPSDWHIANNIPYVQANLVAVKFGYTRDFGLISVGYQGQGITS